MMLLNLGQLTLQLLNLLDKAAVLLLETLQLTLQIALVHALVVLLQLLAFDLFVLVEQNTVNNEL
jgi:hypothetical protein